MNCWPDPLLHRLRPDQFLRFAHPRGLRLRAEKGTLWATVDGEPDDIVLEPGCSHVFSADDAVLVGAVRGEAILTASLPRTGSRWRDWFAALGARAQMPA